MLTITGIQLATILGGVIVVEVVFAWPGLGRLVYNAVAARDYPVHPGRGAADRRAVPAHQPARGPALRRGRPEDPAVMTTSTPPTTATRRCRLAASSVGCWRNPVTVVERRRPAASWYRRGHRASGRAVSASTTSTCRTRCSRPAASTGSAPTNSAVTCSRGCWSASQASMQVARRQRGVRRRRRRDHRHGRRATGAAGSTRSSCASST